MSFTIYTVEARAGDRTGSIYRLGDESTRIEVWPFFGMNCLRWQVQTENRNWGDLLDVAPDWAENPVPTRSGHPVLFPFPNRIENGQFSFGGRQFQLPRNESSGRHAIHGFTPRNPWRVIETTADSLQASITGELHLSQDLPDLCEYWPADFRIRLTYRVSQNQLAVLVRVENPDQQDLPFGLGYHPYFKIPTAPDGPVDRLVVSTTAQTLWESQDGIPTGRRAVPPELDYRQPRAIGEAVLDRLYTDLFPGVSGTRRVVATLRAVDSQGELQIEVPRAFRELLLFTPPHRRSLAIEPYTCASNALNIPTEWGDAGLVRLSPGQTFEGAVTYRWCS